MSRLQCGHSSACIAKDITSSSELKVKQITDLEMTLGTHSVGSELGCLRHG